MTPIVEEELVHLCERKRARAMAPRQRGTCAKGKRQILSPPTTEAEFLS